MPKERTPQTNGNRDGQHCESNGPRILSEPCIVPPPFLRTGLSLACWGRFEVLPEQPETERDSNWDCQTRQKVEEAIVHRSNRVYSTRLLSAKVTNPESRWFRVSHFRNPIQARLNFNTPPSRDMMVTE
jgi:hypothetical protein